MSNVNVIPPWSHNVYAWENIFISLFSLSSRTRVSNIAIVLSSHFRPFVAELLLAPFSLASNSLWITYFVIIHQLLDSMHYLSGKTCRCFYKMCKRHLNLSARKIHWGLIFHTEWWQKLAWNYVVITASTHKIPLTSICIISAASFQLDKVIL